MSISYDDLIAEARRTTQIDDLVQTHMFDGTPYVFKDNPNDYDLLRGHLATALGVPRDAITVVGSSRLGYSLNPSHPGERIKDTSDVDVVVAHADLFDRVWKLLLLWGYPWHTRNWPDGVRPWGIELLENFMAGHWSPHRIPRPRIGRPRYRRRLLDFRDQWFSAFKSTSIHAALAGHEFKGRLYRTWYFATRYHAYGLKMLSRTTP